MNLQSLNLKLLMKAHTKLGLFALFFFYISCFFGTITLFLPQLQTWEKTSRYFVQESEYKPKLNTLINRTIQEEGFSTQKIEITLPNYRDNVIAINDPASRTKYINPYTHKMLDTTSDRSFISTFFNDIHVGRNIPKVGQLLMGMASILTLFLLISGVMLFINKHKVKSTFQFKWHRDLSLILLPYILIFALTGAVLGFMLSSATPLAYAASNTEQSNMRALVGPILFPQDNIPKKSQSATMLNIDDLKQKAQEHYPNLNIQQITLLQWYDKNAQIKFTGFLEDNRILSGRVNRQYIILDATTADIIEKKALLTSHSGNKFLSAFYFFHFIPDETLWVRIIYALLGIGCLASLIFGFMIWSEKKASKYKNERHYFNFLSRFTLAILIGVIPSTALVLCLYWALPEQLFERIIWIKGAFYAFWAFTLVLSTLYEDIVELLKSLALITAVFLFATLLAHIMKATQEIAILVQSGQMHPALYLDIILFILSILSFFFYKKAHKIKRLQAYSRSYHVQ